MKKTYHILILLALNLSNIYSAEFAQKSNNVIEPITINSCLTIIPGRPVTVTTDQSGKPYLNVFISGLSFNETPKSLINFWHENFGTNNKQFFLKFCPTIIQSDGSTFNNLGSLDRKKHKEAKEACRTGQAFYFPYMQGAIIYHLLYKTERYNPFYQTIIEKQTEICRMIDSNQKEPIGILK